MIKLVQTCGACPEQYDALDDDGRKVGYLRLRHGEFTVDYPDVRGKTILTVYPKGDGCFAAEEREGYLNLAIQAIEQEINKESKYDLLARKLLYPDLRTGYVEHDKMLALLTKTLKELEILSKTGGGAPAPKDYMDDQIAPNNIPSILDMLK